MRVVFIPDSYEYYGAPESFMSMIMGLNKDWNVTPIILTSIKGRISRFAEENGFETYVVGHKAFLIGEGNSELRKKIKWIFFPYYFLEYRIANYIAVARAEKFIDFNSVDLIHTNLNRNDLGALLAKRHKLKNVWHIREFGDNDYKCIPLRRNYIEFMNESQNKFIAISDAVMRNWINKGIKKNNIIRIYNGIDTTKFNLINKIECEDKIRLVIVGHLNPTKGHVLLLDAISRLPQRIKSRVVLDIYGDGVPEYKMLLNKIVRDFKIDCIVNFCGYASDIHNILKNYDVGIMASKAEAFGRITVEYMLSGLTVIAANSGANPEIIKNRETGYLFEANSAESLANVIEYVVDNSGMIRQIGKKAHDDAMRRFTQDTSCREIFLYYQKILQCVE